MTTEVDQYELVVLPAYSIASSNPRASRALRERKERGTEIDCLIRLKFA